jgi:putative DNA methylase
MIHYERRLPHRDVVGQPVFVTYRLHGTLPAGRAFPPALLTAGKAFVAMDSILDKAETGPRFLAVPEIASLVVACIRDGDQQFHRYELHAFVVMSNHVHMLITPNVVATKWLGPLKGFTAHKANQILARTGKPFWQQESYDHVVTSSSGLDRVRRYIENNPVKAGLVTRAEDFPWSSARPPERAAAANTVRLTEPAATATPQTAVMPPTSKPA